jgi:DNA polymerase-3 subunit delta'
MAWEIVGHEWAVTLLRRSLATGRIAHAYLFSGPPQVGKTTLARLLAQALNCSDSNPPCGNCPSCLKITRGIHPDVQLVVGEGARESIKIEQVRALKREAVLAPYESRYRVFILRHVDRASVEAANSLLKLLEEPPAHAVIVLTAVDIEALPATIVSRCQRLDLRPAAQSAVESALRHRGMPRDHAQLLARLSGGRVGWAVSASQDKASLSRRKQDLDTLIELLSSDRIERMEFADSVAAAAKAGREPVSSRRRLELWTGWWRDLLLVQAASDRRTAEGVVNVDRLAELFALSGQVTRSQALAALQALQAAADQLEANVNARLAWEGLLLQLPRWHP